jgi:pimeloyl-ACP methyl ester carboxylesterase
MTAYFVPSPEPRVRRSGTLAPVELVYRDVKASGIRLRVTEAGAGPPLLLLHTTFLDRTSWNSAIESLAPHYRVIAPDLPGFGESEKPSVGRFGFGVTDFVHVVTDLFAGLGLGQACVAGHGLGGAIALCLASKSPELVSRLILIDTLCYSTRPDIARRVAALPLLGGLVFKQLWGRAMFGTYFREVLVASHRGISSARIDHYYEMFNTPSARNSVVATLRATTDARTVEVKLSRLASPTLVIWGRHDAVYPAAFGQRLAKEVRGAGFRLLDTGHTPLEEDPASLSANILAFCG